jgi:hypothetical protein
MTPRGAIGGEGGGEGGRGGGGGVAGGEGGIGGRIVAAMTRLTRRSAGALHARIWELPLPPVGSQIHPLLLVPLIHLLTLAVTSMSNQPARVASAVATMGTRYSASLRPCVPVKVLNVVTLAFHGIEISCSEALEPDALASNAVST